MNPRPALQLFKKPMRYRKNCHPDNTFLDIHNIYLDFWYTTAHFKLPGCLHIIFLSSCTQHQEGKWNLSYLWHSCPQSALAARVPGSAAVSFQRSPLPWLSRGCRGPSGSGTEPGGHWESWGACFQELKVMKRWLKLINYAQGSETLQAARVRL